MDYFDKAEYVYIGNLPFSLTEQKLREKLGDLRIEQIIMGTNDEDGYFNGISIVKMQSASEAIKAVNDLAGQSIDGRVMDVKIYSEIK